MSLSDTIKELVVNDYFTPNIKAEVILDTLLTPYIPQILKDQLDIDVVLLAKEMSIPKKTLSGNMGPKVDYVLAGPDTVYLVELKTTDSSIDADQASFYQEICQVKTTFGPVLGKRLLSILNKEFKLGMNPVDLDGSYDVTALKNIFDKIACKHFDRFRFSEPDQIAPEKYADAAQMLIQKNGWAQRDQCRSRKYLYTLGRLVEYLSGDKSETPLWDRPMEVFYLAPPGCKVDDIPCIDLRDAVNNLNSKEKLAGLLQSVVNQIYPVEDSHV